jgi:hypothetical protein
MPFRTRAVPISTIFATRPALELPPSDRTGGELVQSRRCRAGWRSRRGPRGNWIEITTSGSDSIVKVDRDGTGGTYSLAQIATLTGITGLTDEAALVSSGNLVVV